MLHLKRQTNLTYQMSECPQKVYVQQADPPTNPREEFKQNTVYISILPRKNIPAWNVKNGVECLIVNRLIFPAPAAWHPCAMPCLAVTYPCRVIVAFHIHMQRVWAPDYAINLLMFTPAQGVGHLGTRKLALHSYWSPCFPQHELIHHRFAHSPDCRL